MSYKIDPWDHIINRVSLCDFNLIQILLAQLHRSAKATTVSELDKISTWNPQIQPQAWVHNHSLVVQTPSVYSACNCVRRRQTHKKFNTKWREPLDNSAATQPPWTLHKFLLPNHQTCPLRVAFTPVQCFGLYYNPRSWGKPVAEKEKAKTSSYMNKKST